MITNKPKEKAKELVDRFLKVRVDASTFDSIKCKYLDIDEAKQCALICVDEKIKIIDIIMNDKNLDISANATAYVLIKDLQEVKKEIEKYGNRINNE